MQQPTQRMMPMPAEDRRTSTLTAVASAVIGFGVAYLLLLTQPVLAGRVSTFLRVELLPSGARWIAPIAVAGAAIGASGLGIYALRGFLLGVRSAPYLWLAPLLAGLSGAVMLSRSASLGSLGISTITFVAPALLLALAGGALIQARTRALKATGVALWLTPLLLLGLAYLSRAGGVPQAITLPVTEQFFVSMVGATWLALGVIALVAPEPVGAERHAHAEEMLRELRANLVVAETLAAERGRHSEVLLQEQQRLQGQLAAAVERDEEVAAFARRSLGWPLGVALWLCSAGALAVVGYFTLYRPLQVELAALHVRGADAGRAHERSLGGLRAQLDQQREALAQQEQRARDVSAEAAEKGAALAVCQTQIEAAAESQATVASAAKPARVARPPARRSARRAAVRAKREGPDALTAGGDDPIAGLE